MSYKEAMDEIREILAMSDLIPLSELANDTLRLGRILQACREALGYDQVVVQCSACHGVFVIPLAHGGVDTEQDHVILTVPGTCPCCKHGHDLFTQLKLVRVV